METSAKNQAKGNPGVVWFDAHGDLHTMETTTSGFLGGLPYAVALGWDLEDWRLAAGLEQPVQPEAAVLIGASDLDPAEVEALARHPILHVDAEELTQPGVGERIQSELRPRATEAAGPEECPGGFTPAPYWPPREHILEAARETVQIMAVEVGSIAGYNPSADADGRGARFGLDMALVIVG